MQSQSTKIFPNAALVQAAKMSIVPAKETQLVGPVKPPAGNQQRGEIKDLLGNFSEQTGAQFG